MIANYGSGSALHSLELCFYYGIICLAVFPYMKQLMPVILENKLSFALPLWAVFSTVWSQEPKRSFAFAITVVINTVFAIFLAVRFKPKQQMQLFLLVGLVATLGSFLIIGGMPKAGIDYKNHTIGCEGIYPHKNICGVLTAIFMLPAYFYRFKGNSAAFKKASYLFCAVVLSAISTSRTGWLVLLCCLLFVYLAKNLRRFSVLERILVISTLPALATAAGCLIYLYRAELLKLMDKSATLSGRTIIWHAVFLSIMKRPLFGFGYDAFWIGFKGEAIHLALASGAPGLANAENALFQLCLEVGLVGVILILAILGQGVWRAIQCYRSDTPGYALWYMSMIFVEVLALVDGQRYMIPHSIEWTILVFSNACLAMEVKRQRALVTA
ncbi:O-antigen ligase family protein [Silvibacterium dinghuense]|nr:O-antigen ligase family protein [Silvibacterium dinghuense]